MEGMRPQEEGYPDGPAQLALPALPGEKAARTWKHARPMLISICGPRMKRASYERRSASRGRTDDQRQRACRAVGDPCGVVQAKVAAVTVKARVAAVAAEPEEEVYVQRGGLLWRRARALEARAGVLRRNALAALSALKHGL